MTQSHRGAPTFSLRLTRRDLDAINRIRAASQQPDAPVSEIIRQAILDQRSKSSEYPNRGDELSTTAIAVNFLP